MTADHPIPRFRLRPLFVLLATCLLSGCASSSTTTTSTPCIATAPIETAADPLIITSTSSDQVISVVSSDPLVWSNWEQRSAFLSPTSGRHAWLSQLYVPSNKLTDGVVYRESPVLIDGGDSATAYLLVRNTWPEVHNVRLVFLLDQKRLDLVDTSGRSLAYLDVQGIEPQTTQGYEVTLPPLSSGFHQISMLMLFDPSLELDTLEASLIQQKSSSEQRYDFWVDSLVRPTTVPAFADVPTGQAAGSRMGGIEVVTNATDPANQPQVSLQAKAGETVCLHLRLFNSRSDVNAAYSEPLPLAIVALWQDQPTQILRFELPYDAPDALTFSLTLDVPTEPGQYQLLLKAIQFPNYSQFDRTGHTRTGFPNTGDFSRRITVTVSP